MKKTGIILTCLLTFMTYQVSAQFYVGGNFSLSSTGGKYDNGSKKPSNLSLNLNPEMGKFISENLAAGISFHLGTSTSSNQNEVETITRSSSFGLVPYLRYYSVITGKLSLFAQAYAGIGLENSKTKFDGNITDGPSETTLSLGVFPGLSYELNEKISFETSVNLFNIGIYTTTEKNGGNKETDTHLSLGAGMDNIINTSNISVGAIFKF